MATTILKTRLPPLDARLVERWRAVPTTITADLFDGAVLADPRIKPLNRLAPGPALCGRIVTARCEPPDFGCVLHAIDLAVAGDILMIAANGYAERAMIGEILGGAARRKGVLGIVCDGAVRDIGMLASWTDFPVFTLATTARGPASKHGGTVNGPVTFGGVQADAGDLLVADDDGIVILTPNQMSTRIEAAEARCRAELDWQEKLRNGATLVEALDVPAAILAGD
jgi:regulator of RNase E activity RraA